MAREEFAAGGLVWRDTPGGFEFVVVYRPRYDDWSLPKGKQEPGEDPLDTALREVREETGLRCAPGRELITVRYDTPRGRTKTVRWWEMTVLEDLGHEPDDEVDRRRWVDETRFLGLDPYRSDLAVVHSFVTFRSGRGHP